MYECSIGLHLTVRGYVLPFCSTLFVLNNTCEVKTKIGNSINGPITNDNAINGSDEKADTAIANEIGEFLAIVVNTRLTLSA